jgi:acyl-CoA thioester hydrolase
MPGVTHPSREPTAYAFTHPVRTRFAETDAMAVVHHGSYLLYLEEARVAWLRSLGNPYAEMRAGGIDIAVLQVEVSYLRAVRFDEVVDVALRPADLRRATFGIEYLLTVDGEPRATARSRHGCVDGQGRAARMPPALANLLGSGSG